MKGSLERSSPIIVEVAVAVVVVVVATDQEVKVWM